MRLRQIVRRGLLLALFAARSTGPVFAEPARSKTPSPDAVTYARIPLSFEENRGQADASIRFVSHGPGYSLCLKPAEADFVLGRSLAPVRMRFIGGDVAGSMTGLVPQPNKTNYFLGAESRRWRTNLPNFARVAAKDVYPGIDVVFHGDRRRLEYDVVLAPGARPESLRIAFDGIGRLTLDPSGDLVLMTAHGEIRQAKPVVYQEVHGRRRPLEAEYTRRGRREVGFRVSGYDPKAILVIDPAISYASYLGGTGDDQAVDIGVDDAGNAYVTGTTSSTDFPDKNAFQPGTGAHGMLFVSKIASDGSALVYSTYFGGSGSDSISRIAVDGVGNTHIVGTTDSTDFPKKSALQGTKEAGTDAFVAKLDPAGSLLFSTYLGGSGDDSGAAIGVDAAGDIFVAGSTDSTDFPMHSPLQPSIGGGVDVFVAKFRSDGAAILYSTYVGGSGDQVAAGIAADRNGNAYVLNSTGLVTKLDASGLAIAYSIQLSLPLGLPGLQVFTSAFDIGVDPGGNAYVTGVANGRPPGYDHVHRTSLTRINATGSVATSLSFSANPLEEFFAHFPSIGRVTVSGTGRVLVVHSPVTSSCLLGTCTGVPQPSRVTEVTFRGQDLRSRDVYVAASVDIGIQSVAAAKNGDVLITGATGSTSFVTQNALQPSNAGGMDGFVAKIVGLVPATLIADPSAGGRSDGNGILEPGETIAVQASWKNGAGDATVDGTADGFSGPSGPTYGLPDAHSSYGEVASGATASCTAAADCYSMSVSKPASRPATHWDVSFAETLSTGDWTTWAMHVGDSFADVPRSHPFYKKIEALLHSGMTSGCGATTFCPNNSLTNAEIYIFLAKALAGGGANIPIGGTVNGDTYVCAPGGRSVFLDVGPTDAFCKHGHYLVAQGIINPSLSDPVLIPDRLVPRSQMAVWISRAILRKESPDGSALVFPTTYGPDPTTGRSYSCDLTSPSTHFVDADADSSYCRPTHFLWAKGIVGGCSATQFCLNDNLTRDQMAKFLINAFPAPLNSP